MQRVRAGLLPNFFPAARQAQLVAEGPALAGQGHVDQPHRLAGTVSVWAGKPGGGKSEISLYRTPRPFGHLSCHRFRNRAEGLQRLMVYP